MVDEDDRDEEDEVMRGRWRALMERLAADPALAMRSDVWGVVLPWLQIVATDVDRGMCGLVTGAQDWMALGEVIRADKAARASLRWALLLCLMSACDAQESEADGPLAEVEGVLGV